MVQLLRLLRVWKQANDYIFMKSTGLSVATRKALVSDRDLASSNASAKYSYLKKHTSIWVNSGGGKKIEEEDHLRALVNHTRGTVGLPELWLLAYL